MNIKYNKTLIIMLSILLPSLYLFLLNFNSSITLAIILFFISYVGFKIRKSKNINLSLIILAALFALGNSCLGLYELNLISI
ncbi:hypothetical protein [Faecalimicrobium dakarense]|uniref:hypothetical protein n=1 Tax=Faecalimicrobium dakarense TaxID=1301100 RepID=UPI0005A7C914|nr:hypothetical protein [[Clostridium] dakarense]